MEIIKENCYRQTHYVHKPISLKCKTLSQVDTFVKGYQTSHTRKL